MPRRQLRPYAADSAVRWNGQTAASLAGMLSTEPGKDAVVH